jgi:hypothetical protein
MKLFFILCLCVALLASTASAACCSLCKQSKATVNPLIPDKIKDIILNAASMNRTLPNFLKAFEIVPFLYTQAFAQVLKTFDKTVKAGNVSCEVNTNNTDVYPSQLLPYQYHKDIINAMLDMLSKKTPSAAETTYAKLKTNMLKALIDQLD